MARGAVDPVTGVPSELDEDNPFGGVWNYEECLCECDPLWFPSLTYPAGPNSIACKEKHKVMMNLGLGFGFTLVFFMAFYRSAFIFTSFAHASGWMHSNAFYFVTKNRPWIEACKADYGCGVFFEKFTVDEGEARANATKRMAREEEWATRQRRLGRCLACFPHWAVPTPGNVAMGTADPARPRDAADEDQVDTEAVGYLITLDRTSVRAEPSLTGKVTVTLPAGEEVPYVGWAVLRLQNCSLNCYKLLNCGGGWIVDHDPDRKWTPVVRLKPRPLRDSAVASLSAESVGAAGRWKKRAAKKKTGASAGGAEKNVWRVSLELNLPHGLVLEREGLTIMQVSPGTQAEQLGISPGCTIVSVNGRDLDSQRDFHNALRACRRAAARPSGPEGSLKFAGRFSLGLLRTSYASAAVVTVHTSEKHGLLFAGGGSLRVVGFEDDVSVGPLANNSAALRRAVPVGATLVAVDRTPVTSQMRFEDLYVKRILLHPYYHYLRRRHHHQHHYYQLTSHPHTTTPILLLPSLPPLLPTHLAPISATTAPSASTRSASTSSSCACRRSCSASSTCASRSACASTGSTSRTSTRPARRTPRECRSAPPCSRATATPSSRWGTSRASLTP